MNAIQDLYIMLGTSQLTVQLVKPPETPTMKAIWQLLCVLK